LERSAPSPYPSPPKTGARGPEKKFRRIAVLEAVCAGLCGESPEPSLLAEGQAMRDAVLADLQCIPGCTAIAASSLDEACDTDAAILIAPETDGLLARLVTSAQQRPALRLWNATPSAIHLCTDKLELARHLTAHGIATLPTDLETWTAPPISRCVIKPRDGAGSWLVRRVDDAADWRRVRTEYAASAATTIALRQPFVPGRALSIAAWFGDDFVDWLPIGEQRLSDDGRFRYLGGRLPAELTADEAAAVLFLVQSAAATIPGLRGYIGFDVLQPADNPLRPLLVEINPRFTTSYVGYRRLIAENLLERWLTISCATAVSAVSDFPAGSSARTADTAVAHRSILLPISTAPIEFDANGHFHGAPSR